MSVPFAVPSEADTTEDISPYPRSRRPRQDRRGPFSVVGRAAIVAGIGSTTRDPCQPSTGSLTYSRSYTADVPVCVCAFDLMRLSGLRE